VQRSDLRRLEPQFAKRPVFAFHCGLNKPGDGSWVVGADSLMEDKTEEEDLLVHFASTPDQQLWKVDISIRGKDLAKMIFEVETNLEVKKGTQEIAFRKAPTPPPKSVVVLSHAEDVRHIYCHPQDAVVRLMSLASILDQIYMGCLGTGDGPAVIQEPTIGQACVARCASEDQWCRGQVIDKDDTRISVMFVDYGSTDWVLRSNVREVSPDLPNDAAHAIGPLSLVPPEAEVKADATVKLLKAVEDQTEFYLEMCTVGDHVRLTSIENNKDIVAILDLAQPPNSSFCHDNVEITKNMEKIQISVDGNDSGRTWSPAEDESSTTDEESSLFTNSQQQEGVEEEGGRWEVIGELIEIPPRRDSQTDIQLENN